jgi:hypothetical protein
MTPTEAAAEYWATLDQVSEHKPIATRHDKATKVIKDHMVAKSLTTYQGIRLNETSPFERLDQAAAIAKFGDKLKDCIIEQVRRSLIPVKRPSRLAKS